MKTVTDWGEDRVIEELCSGLASADRVLVGPGDDCAVIETGDALTLLKTDSVISGVHFLATEDPERVGWKAVARVLSDFAAMGGRPGEFLVTIAVSKKTEINWLKALYAGMSKCLAQFGGVIVGGETSALPDGAHGADGAPTVISISGRGTVERQDLVTRSGAKAGDAVYVTGLLGGSIAGKHLDFQPRLRESTWLCQNFKPSAMMDLSDGVAKDLPRLAKMSAVGFHLDALKLPCTPGVSLEKALSDGEDYELLFTRAPQDELETAWAREFPEIPLTQIGKITEGACDSFAGGWDHFTKD